MTDKAWLEKEDAISEPRFKLSDLLKLRPTYWIVLAVFAIDLIILGPAAGTHLTASNTWDATWTRVHAFANGYFDADSLTLALVTSQIAALTLWCFNSRRILVLRIGVWLAASVFLSFAIIAQAGNSFQFLSMCFVLIPLGIGVFVGHTISNLIGFRISNTDRQDFDSRADKQFGLSELMLLSAVASLLCILVGWLNYVEAFKYLDRIPGWIRAEPMYFPKAVCNGILGGMISVAAWGALAPSRVFLRSILSFALIALICCGTRVFLDQYSQFVALSYANDGSNAFAGWAAWWMTHTVVSLLLLATSRLCGVRLKLQTHAPQTNGAQKNRAQAMQRKLALGFILAATVAGLYLAASQLPSYLTNRRLLTSLAPLKVSLFRTQDQRVIMTIDGELDEKVAESLIEHAGITDLYVMSVPSADTLEQVKRLRFLSALYFLNHELPHKVLQKIQADMPMTTVHQW